MHISILRSIHSIILRLYQVWSRSDRGAFADVRAFYLNTAEKGFFVIGFDVHYLHGLLKLYSLIYYDLAWIWI